MQSDSSHSTMGMSTGRHGNLRLELEHRSDGQHSTDSESELGPSTLPHHGRAVVLRLRTVAVTAVLRLLEDIDAAPDAAAEACTLAT